MPLFQDAGVDMKRPVVTTCGSGVTAAVLALGLHLAGHRDVALYDGSWAEWGQPGDTPVETGAGMSRKKSQRATLEIGPYEETERDDVVALWEACKLRVPWNDVDQDIALIQETPHAELLIGEG